VAPIDDLSQLADTVTANLKNEAFPDMERLPGAYESRASHQAYQAFLSIYRSARMAKGPVAWQDHLTQLRQIRKHSPGLLDAHVLEISIAAFLTRQQPDPAIVHQAEEALAEALELAPADQRTLRAEAELALALDDYERLQRVIDSLDRIAPDQPCLHLLRARLAAMRGNQDQALALMRSWVELRPSAYRWFQLGLMAIGMGRAEQARADLQRGFERLPPGSTDDLSGSPDQLRERLGLDRPWVH
jgi:tetratricopeptide (TPR) repeat protein